jgi:hypothetical protein
MYLLFYSLSNFLTICIVTHYFKKSTPILEIIMNKLFKIRSSMERFFSSAGFGRNYAANWG